MTAKMDLLAKLTALMPECAGEIAKILHDYEIMPAKVYERSNLPRRVDAFLAAKRIDGCRPKTLEGYRERLVWRPARCKECLAAPALRDVELQHELRADGKINRSLLAALADHLALALLPVDVLHTQSGDLRHTAAGRDQKFDQSLFLIALAPIADELQLLGRQRMSGTQLVDTQ